MDHGTAGIRLSETAEPRVTSNPDLVWFDFGFLPDLSTSVNLETLRQSFGFKEDRHGLLTVINLAVGVEAKPIACPATVIGINPVSGQMPKFETTFPSLEKLPDSYQKLRLNSLRTSLEEAIDQQPGGDLDVFGVKIPSDFIALFGLPVLAALLFQFAAVGSYVASHCEQVELDEASEWAFLLKGWPFMVMAFGAICLFPLGAAISTWVFLIGSNPLSKPWHLAFSLIVAMLSVFAFIEILRVRSRVCETEQTKRVGEAENE
jgi:hypothetical protein